MTRQLPDEIRQIGESLHAEAGSYLHSVVRDPSVTCKVCSLPVQGYENSPQCHRHAQSEHDLADRVASLIYAVEYDSQAYRLVQGYKSDRPGPSHEDLMRALLALGLRGHNPCAKLLSGCQSHGWAVVPSTRDRTKLQELVRGLSQRPQDEVRVQYDGEPTRRELRPDGWTILGDTELPEHVLIIDDSWVTGSNAQSVAAALKTAGVHQVSIFTVARVLSPDWPPNKAFIANHLARPSFDWTQCPWTGGPCPQ